MGENIVSATFNLFHSLFSFFLFLIKFLCFSGRCTEASYRLDEDHCGVLGRGGQGHGHYGGVHEEVREYY